jgi:hypothetical protein
MGVKEWRTGWRWALHLHRRLFDLQYFVTLIGLRRQHFVAGSSSSEIQLA